jgi:CelD/BcsL family acetyltransferase involved in cellulose biosynthesis
MARVVLGHRAFAARRPLHGTAKAMHVHVIDSLDGFMALKSEYDALSSGSPHSPFSSHRWLAAWWQTYHRLGAIRAFCLSDERGLAMMLPVQFSRGSIGRIPIHKVSYLGGGWGEVEVRHRGLAAEGAERFVRWLESEGAPPWSVLHFGPVLDDDPLALGIIAAFERRRRPSSRIVIPGPYIPLAPTWEAFAQTRSKNFRRTVKRKQSAADEAGLTVRLIVNPTGEQVRETVGRVSRESWQGKRGVAVATSEEGARFYDTVTRSTGEFQIDLAVLETDGRCVGYLLGLRQDRVFHAFDTGFTPEFAEQSPGSLLHYRMLQLLCDGSTAEFNFGHAHDYKERFDPSYRTKVELDFYRTPALAGLAGTVGWIKRKRAALMRMRQKREHSVS